MSLARLVELLENSHSSVAAATAVQTLTVLGRHSTHQITIEVVLTATGLAHVPAAGTLQVAFRAYGATGYENMVNTIPLTAAPRTIVLNGSFDSLKFTPVNVDGDCGFEVQPTGMAHVLSSIENP